MYTGYNNTGTSLSAWLTSKGGLTTYAFVTTWYDQSNSGNHATQSTTTVQPIYDVSAKIINFGNTTAGYGIASPQTNCYFNIRDGAFPYGDSSFTYITSYRNAPTGGILFSGGKNNNTGGQAGNCSMLLNSVNYYLGIWNNDYSFTPGPITSNNATILTVKYQSNSGAGVRYGYVNGSAASPASSTMVRVREQLSTFNTIGSGVSWWINTCFNGTLKYFYVFGTALSDSDRAIWEAT